MTRMMSDYYHLEQLRAAEPKREPVDLLQLLQNVQKEYAEELALKDLLLTTDLPTTFPAIMGDAAQLAQMLFQLVGNAVRFTPEGGSIWLRLRQYDNHAQIEVGDTGYGIPIEAQDRLFQEFYRVRTADTAALTGSGLGLSLVKSVVDAHGGRIHVSSAEGEGSSFTVMLPIT
jgi:two-component system, OmpR family, phosphate regulon sensor histidine kinase PhoR